MISSRFLVSFVIIILFLSFNQGSKLPPYKTEHVVEVFDNEIEVIEVRIDEELRRKHMAEDARRAVEELKKERMHEEKLWRQEFLENKRRLKERGASPRFAGMRRPSRTRDIKYIPIESFRHYYQSKIKIPAGLEKLHGKSILRSRFVRSVNRCIKALKNITGKKFMEKSRKREE